MEMLKLFDRSYKEPSPIQRQRLYDAMFTLTINSSTPANVRLYTITFNNHMDELTDLGDNFREEYYIHHYVRATKRLFPVWHARQRPYQRNSSPLTLLEVQADLLAEADDRAAFLQRRRHKYRRKPVAGS